MRFHHWLNINARQGFTLVEVLLAIALMTMLATAAISWSISQRRAGALIVLRLQQTEAVAACVRLLEDDLLFAVRRDPRLRPQADGHLRFVTRHAVPGDNAGDQSLDWYVRPAGDQTPAAILRQRLGSNVNERVVLSPCAAARFMWQENRGLALEVTFADAEPIMWPVRMLP